MGDKEFGEFAVCCVVVRECGGDWETVGELLREMNN
jgi:hypothetical protein